MNRAEYQIEIVKNNFIPYLKGDDIILSKKIDWGVISSVLFKYEEDPKPLYAEIYKLRLVDSENLISKLDEIYELIVEEFAEDFVKNEHNVLNKVLYKSTLFKEKVNFFRTLKSVITKQENQRIIQEEKDFIDFKDTELSDDEKKFADEYIDRSELKNKFKIWDKELKDEDESIAAISSIEKVKSKLSLVIFWFSITSYLEISRYLNTNFKSISSTEVAMQS